MFMATVMRTSNLCPEDTSTLKLSSAANKLMINIGLQSLPVVFLSGSDMKYEAEAVSLQKILSTSGVPTATLAVSVTSKIDINLEICKNRPMYIFVTSGLAVQEFLKQVGQYLVNRKVLLGFTSAFLICGRK